MPFGILCDCLFQCYHYSLSLLFFLPFKIRIMFLANYWEGDFGSGFVNQNVHFVRVAWCALPVCVSLCR